MQISICFSFNSVRAIELVLFCLKFTELSEKQVVIYLMLLWPLNACIAKCLCLGRKFKHDRLSSRSGFLFASNLNFTKFVQLTRGCATPLLIISDIFLSFIGGRSTLSLNPNIQGHESCFELYFLGRILVKLCDNVIRQLKRLNPIVANRNYDTLSLFFFKI